MELVKYIATYTQLLTFILSLFTFYKYKHTYLRYIPIVIGINVAVELTSLHFYRNHNVWMYNITLILEFNIYSFIFYHYLSRIQKKFLIILTSIFNLFVIYCMAFDIQNFLNESFSYANVMAYAFMIIILIMVFGQMLNSDKLEGVTRNLLFWISFGLLIYYATSLPLFSISNWSKILGDLKFQVAKVLFVVIELLNIIFMIGFLWSKKKFTY